MSTNNGHQNNGKLTKKVRKSGRPTKLTPKVQDTICKAIAHGSWENAAALKAGVSLRAHLNWKQRGNEDLEAGEDTIYSVYALAIKEAHELNKGELVEIGNEAARNGDWKAAYTSLERRYRSEFGRNEVSGPVKVEHGLSPWLQAALENAQSRQLAPMYYDREIIVPDSEAEDA